MTRNNNPTAQTAHRPNSRPKTAYLEPDRLTDEPCDLEFRPATAYSPLALAAAAAKGLFIAATVPIVSGVIAYGQFELLSQVPFAAVVVFTLIVIVVVRNAYYAHPVPTFGGTVVRWAGRFVGRYALACALGIAFLWLLPRAGLVNSLRIYIVVSVVMCTILADSIATHAVYWMTASPRADMSVLLTWRDDWKTRFTRPAQYALPLSQAGAAEQEPYDAAITARSVYVLGTVWIAAALTFPVVIAFLTVDEAGPLGLRLHIASWTTASLVLASLIRCRGRFMAFVHMVVHWLEYRLPTECPPWVFRSPCGYQAGRRTLLYGTIAVLSILFFHVVGGLASTTEVDAGARTPSSLVPRIAMTATFSAVFCLTQVAASVTLMAGPLINALYDLLERN